MDRLALEAFTDGMTTNTMTTNHPFDTADAAGSSPVGSTGDDHAFAGEPLTVDHGLVAKATERRSFCTLATVSPNNWPHVAGVLYETVDMTLYANTMRTSRKARNIAANPHVGVCIPVRRLPVGPPSSIQFQATAELLAADDPQIVELVDAGKLKSITSHGELETPGVCFVRITPVRRINTYGLGMPLHRFLRDPLNAMGTADMTN